MYNPEADGGGTIAASFHKEIALVQVVERSEQPTMNTELGRDDASTFAEVITRHGGADVCAFALAWDDCEERLRKPG